MQVTKRGQNWPIKRFKLKEVGKSYLHIILIMTDIGLEYTTLDLKKHYDFVRAEVLNNGQGPNLKQD